MRAPVVVSVDPAVAVARRITVSRDAADWLPVPTALADLGRISPDVVADPEVDVVSEAVRKIVRSRVEVLLPAPDPSAVRMTESSPSAVCVAVPTAVACLSRISPEVVAEPDVAFDPDAVLRTVRSVTVVAEPEPETDADLGTVRRRVALAVPMPDADPVRNTIRTPVAVCDPAPVAVAVRNAVLTTTVDEVPTACESCADRRTVRNLVAVEVP